MLKFLPPSADSLVSYLMMHSCNIETLTGAYRKKEKENKNVILNLYDCFCIMYHGHFVDKISEDTFYRELFLAHFI